MANYNRRSLSWVVLCAGVLSFGSLSALADEPATAVDLNTVFDDEPAYLQLKSSELVDDLEPKGVPNVLPAGEEILSLSRLEELALAHNPTMQQAAANLEKAKGIHTQVGLKPNPIFGYQAAEIGNEGRAGQQGVFLGQEFVTAGKLGLNRAIANQDIERSRWQFQMQQYRVVNDVRSSYYRLLGARETVKLLEQLVSLAEANLKAARELFEAGQAARPQVLQATVEVQNNRIALRNARNQLEASWRQLTAAIGVPTLPRARVAGDLTQAAPVPWTGMKLLTGCKRTVRKSSQPLMQLVVLELQLSERELNRFPTSKPKLGCNTTRATRDTVAGVQIGIPIPVHNRNQGNIRAAQGELIRASREVERVQLSLRPPSGSKF